MILKPDEARYVRVSLDHRALSYYDVEKEDWAAAPGEVAILVGGSSDNMPLGEQVLC